MGVRTTRGVISFIVPIIVACVIASLFGRKEPSPNKDSSFGKFSNFQDGDIIFQVSKSSQSKAIQLATHSKYSHMGIIFLKNGYFYVYEATQPVKFTDLKEWINRGENSHYAVKRLKNAALLQPYALDKMKFMANKFRGKKYDIYFNWSDENMYCSELVWKIYYEALGIEIGKLQRLQDFDLSSEVVKTKLRERYGENIPLDEKVISPAAMFESELLENVPVKK